MSTRTTDTAAPLTFDRFWRWLGEHPNCIVRAGGYDTALFDHEDFHWDFLEEEDGRAVVQLIRGKGLVGELVIDRREVLFVQAAPDVEDAARGFWLFECIGGPKDDTYSVCHFLISHGMEQSVSHQMLKH